MTQNVFIAATRQNDGKTMSSLGLISALKNRFGKVGFMKPVGQRYIEVDGHKIDEDSVLVEKVCGLDCRLADMSPIAEGAGPRIRKDDFPANSRSHARLGGQNVLRGNLSVRFFKNPHVGIENDDIYRLIGVQEYYTGLERPMARSDAFLIP